MELNNNLATIHEIAAVYPVLCPESFLTDVPGRSRIRAEVHLKVPANLAGMMQTSSSLKEWHDVESPSLHKVTSNLPSKCTAKNMDQILYK